MDVMSTRIDPDTKRRMATLHDVNWAAVIRDALKERLEVEEEFRGPIDHRRALRGVHASDRIRERLQRSDFDATREVRKWRNSRK
jgi:hypothetical protein